MVSHEFLVTAMELPLLDDVALELMLTARVHSTVSLLLAVSLRLATLKLVSVQLKIHFSNDHLHAHK